MLYLYENNLSSQNSLLFEFNRSFTKFTDLVLDLLRFSIFFHGFVNFRPLTTYVYVNSYCAVCQGVPFTCKVLYELYQVIQVRKFTSKNKKRLYALQNEINPIISSMKTMMYRFYRTKKYKFSFFLFNVEN